MRKDFPLHQEFRRREAMVLSPHRPAATGTLNCVAENAHCHQVEDGGWAAINFAIRLIRRIGHFLRADVTTVAHRSRDHFERGGAGGFTDCHRSKMRGAASSPTDSILAKFSHSVVLSSQRPVKTTARCRVAGWTLQMNHGHWARKAFFQCQLDVSVASVENSGLSLPPMVPCIRKLVTTARGWFASSSMRKSKSRCSLCFNRFPSGLGSCHLRCGGRHKFRRYDPSRPKFRRRSFCRLCPFLRCQDRLRRRLGSRWYCSS